MKSVLDLARLFVGGVFLVTGILKLPELERVSAFIAGVTASPSSWADMLATTLVVMEIVAGSGLLIGWKVGLWSRVAGLLLLTFLVAPLAFPASWATRPCPCFGLPFPGMPQVLHLLLNLILLNASLMMVMAGDRGNRSRDSFRSLSALQWITLTAVGAASVAYLFFHESKVLGGAGLLLPGDRVGRINEFLDRKSFRGRGSVTGGRIALFLNGEGFGCPMCVEDLQAMCDSLNRLVAQYPDAEVVAVLRGGRRTSAERVELMAEAWARSNHIRFPVVGDTEGISASVGSGMSILLLDQHDSVLLLEEFPLGAEKRSDILRMLGEMQKGGG